MSPTPPPSRRINQKEIGYYKSYASFAKTLRTWFVAYGIGGPVILLTHDAAWGKLVDSGFAPYVGLLFLYGGIMQLISALLSKHAMWYLYFGELEPDSQSKTIYKMSYWFSDQGWIEVTLDLATMVMFGWGTWLGFSILTGTNRVANSGKSWWAGFAIVLISIGFVLIVIVAYLKRKTKESLTVPTDKGDGHKLDRHIE
jgi:hypothetical protein